MRNKEVERNPPQSDKMFYKSKKMRVFDWQKYQTFLTSDLLSYITIQQLSCAHNKILKYLNHLNKQHLQQDHPHLPPQKSARDKKIMLHVERRCKILWTTDAHEKTCVQSLVCTKIHILFPLMWITMGKSYTAHLM